MASDGSATWKVLRYARPLLSLNSQPAVRTRAGGLARLSIVKSSCPGVHSTVPLPPLPFFVVGPTVVGLALVGLAVVKLAVVGLAVVGLAVVGLAVVGLAVVGLGNPVGF